MDVDILDRSRERMNKTIEALKRELSGMKAGRANPQKGQGVHAGAPAAGHHLMGSFHAEGRRKGNYEE